MRIKLDENLPATLAGLLADLGRDADTVSNERMTGKADDAVWEAAQAAARFLITQDLGFSDARRFIPGTHAGLLLVRLRRPGRRALSSRIRTIFGQEEVESWKGCLVVATDRKLRVRRPGSETSRRK